MSYQELLILNSDYKNCISTQWEPEPPLKRINRFWMESRRFCLEMNPTIILYFSNHSTTEKGKENKINILYIDSKGLHLGEHKAPKELFPYATVTLDKDGFSCIRISVINSRKYEEGDIKVDCLIKEETEFLFSLREIDNRIRLYCRNSKILLTCAILEISENGLRLCEGVEPESVPFPLNSQGQILWV